MSLVAATLCLALNIYHESRGEPLAGQLAVAAVTINRVRSPKHPDTICKVVKQARYHEWDQVNPIRYKCSFSWFCDGKSDVPTNDKEMLESTLIAQHVMMGNFVDITEGATHYFNPDKVNPYWAKTENFILKIGNHAFYR